MAVVVFVLLLAVAAGVAMLILFPEETVTWFERARTARTIVFGIAGVIIAFVFIGSGYTPLVIVGFLMLVYGVIWVLVDRPDEMVLDAVS